MRDLVSELATLYLRPPPAASTGVPFSAWLTTFRKSTAGRDALRALADVERYGPTGAQYSALVIGILQACYFASQFRPTADPGHQYRQRIAAERRARPELRTAVARLCTLLEAAPTIVRETAPGLPDALAAFDKRLRAQLPELDGGPWLHRFTFACLHYETPREGRHARAPDVAGALLFNAVFAMRCYTSGESVSWQAGQAMPTTGRPCYRAAALLASATLKASGIDERTARTRVESLQRSGATLMRWPNDATPHL